MGCGEEKLPKSLTQTFMAHCNVMIYQQVTLSGDAEWPKVADAVIEAPMSVCLLPSLVRGACGNGYGRPGRLGASTQLSRDPCHNRHCKKHRRLPGKESLTDVVGYAMIVNGILHSVRQNASETLPVAVLSY